MKKTLLLTTGIILLLAGVWLLVADQAEAPTEVDPSISSFAECLEAGYPQLDSHPAQCETPDGKRFVENLPADELADVTTSATIAGRIVCLPHWDTSGPQTLECAIGLQSTAGDYYTLANFRDESGDLSTGHRVTINGQLVPGSDARYRSIGTIEVADVSAWSEHTDSDSGITFQYPESPGGEYLEFVDWPPQVEVLAEPFSCTEAGNATDRAGETQSRTIDGEDYCVTTVTEGAAGSTYHQYAYLTEEAGETVSLTFSTRQPQCGNFPEGQRAQCERQQESVDTDALAAGIVETIE